MLGVAQGDWNGMNGTGTAWAKSGRHPGTVANSVKRAKIENTRKGLSLCPCDQGTQESAYETQVPWTGGCQEAAL